MSDKRKQPAPRRKNPAPPPAPEIDQRVKLVKYLDRNGDPQERACQDFHNVAQSADAISIIWLGDAVAQGKEGVRREIVAQTCGILEWEMEVLKETWEEYIKKI